MSEAESRSYSLGELIRSDLYRYHGRLDPVTALKVSLFYPGFICSFWYRVCHWLKRHIRRGHAYLWPIYLPSRVMHRYFTVTFGISIPVDTVIGPGLYIGHFGGIVLSEDAVVGANCNLSHGVTLGQTYRGERAGSPTLGDEIYVGPGAKVIGRVRIGNRAAIGANAVVTRDVPEHMAVGGIPAKEISKDGSEGYVNYVWGGQ